MPPPGRPAGKLAFPILPALANNPPLRCYLCKHALFSSLAARAAEMGFPLLADGSNLDDLDDYRPGRKALQELGIPSPFLEASMDKADIRRLACRLGLPESVSGKPAYACLLTRLEHNRPVTEVLLRRVDAAESFLRTLGLKGCRVRVHGDSLARIELPEKDVNCSGTDSLPPLQHAGCGNWASGTSPWIWKDIPEGA